MNRRHLVVSSMAVSALGVRGVSAAQSATPAAGTETCPVTSTAENTAVARRWFEDVISGHDLSVLDEILAPESNHDAPDHHDENDTRVVLKRVLDAFPDIVSTVDQTIAEGDFVTVRWTRTGTQEGEYLGHAPTGKSTTVTGINIFRFECGLIAEVWSEVDLLGLFKQLDGPVDDPAATPTS